MAQPSDLGRQEVRPAVAARRVRWAVDLIYIDPPFATGADFSFSAAVPNLTRRVRQAAERHRAEGISGHVGQRPRQLRPVACTTRRPTSALCSRRPGSIYVHLDWPAVHYAKVILDEVFGVDDFKKRNRLATGQYAQRSWRLSAASTTHLLYYRRPGASSIRSSASTARSTSSRHTGTKTGGRRYRLLPLHATTCTAAKTTTGGLATRYSATSRQVLAMEPAED